MCRSTSLPSCKRYDSHVSCWRTSLFCFLHFSGLTQFVEESNLFDIGISCSIVSHRFRKYEYNESLSAPDACSECSHGICALPGTQSFALSITQIEETRAELSQIAWVQWQVRRGSTGIMSRISCFGSQTGTAQFPFSLSSALGQYRLASISSVWLSL